MHDATLLESAQAMLDGVHDETAWRKFARRVLAVAGSCPPAPSPEAIEAAARALWKMGNARIGERPWESVAAHYIAEATVALEAARGVDRGSPSPTGESA